MSRNIDADAFDERVRIAVGFDEEELTDDFKDGVRCTLELLKTQPTADVVEVVRCKDCDWFIVNEIKADGTTDKRYKPTWCTYHNGYMNDDDFCSYGERREDAEAVNTKN